MSDTHFGFTTVDEKEKAAKVAAVFSSVAPNYDLMNDAMSMGMHRAWKWFTVKQAAVKNGERVLDIASGSADLARAFAPQVGPSGMVFATDINAAMLEHGRDKLINAGVITPCIQCDAERLPFPDRYFDVVTVAFGLRNMTHKDLALAEMQRVLKPMGRLLILEFSQVLEPVRKIYDWYSFNILPKLGDLLAKDGESYRYLAESIRMHPSQEALKQMMEAAGFSPVRYTDLTMGVVALHHGIKTV